MLIAVSTAARNGEFILTVLLDNGGTVRGKVKSLIDGDSRPGEKMGKPPPGQALSWTEKDWRAVLALVLVVITGILAAYGMNIGWTVTDVLSLLAFFGPLDTAAITYYFAGKQAESLK